MASWTKHADSWLKCDILLDPKKANALRLYDYLLLSAFKRPGRKDGVEIPRGAVPKTEKNLANILNLSRQEFRTALAALLSANKIAVTKYTGFTVFSVIDYDCDFNKQPHFQPQNQPQNQPHFQPQKQPRKKVQNGQCFQGVSDFGSDANNHTFNHEINHTFNHKNNHASNHPSINYKNNNILSSPLKGEKDSIEYIYNITRIRARDGTDGACSEELPAALTEEELRAALEAIGDKEPEELTETERKLKIWALRHS